VQSKKVKKTLFASPPTKKSNRQKKSTRPLKMPTNTQAHHRKFNYGKHNYGKGTFRRTQSCDQKTFYDKNSTRVVLKKVFDETIETTYIRKQVIPSDVDPDQNFEYNNGLGYRSSMESTKPTHENMEYSFDNNMDMGAGMFRQDRDLLSEAYGLSGMVEENLFTPMSPGLPISPQEEADFFVNDTADPTFYTHKSWVPIQIIRCFVGDPNIDIAFRPNNLLINIEFKNLLSDQLRNAWLNVEESKEYAKDHLLDYMLKKFGEYALELSKSKGTL